METGIRGISHVIVDEIHERDINVSQLVMTVLISICFCSVNFWLCLCVVANMREETVSECQMSEFSCFDKIF